AQLSQAQPAQINFYAVGVKNVRTSELSEPIKIATLQGTLNIGSNADKVVFTCDNLSLDTLSKPPDVTSEEGADKVAQRQWLVNLEVSPEHFIAEAPQDTPRGPLALV